MSVIIHGKEVATPDPIISTNYFSGGEPHLAKGPRKKQLTNIVIHETAGLSAGRAKATLEKKGYGIHLIVARDGSISNHADLATEICIHGNQLNPISIGIEFINPYYPKLGKRAPYEVEIIPAQWHTHIAGEKGYVLPTKKQIETACILIPWLCSKLNIPYTFPTWFLNAKQPRIKGWQLRAQPGPGIVAHRDFAGHSDGRWILERLILDSAFNAYES